MKYLDKYNFWVDDNDSLEIEKHEGVYDLEETMLIKELVKPDWVCMDIGACFGYFTLIMSRQCKYVYAYEADPINFQILRKNVAAIPYTTNPAKYSGNPKNVELYGVAVGSNEQHNKTTRVYRNNSNCGMSRVYRSQWANGEIFPAVDMISIDMNFDFNRQNNQHINFIKLDVEGYEYNVLRGMHRLLLRDKPILLMEFHPPSIEEAGDNPEKIYELLKTYLGYKRIDLIPSSASSINTYEGVEDIQNYNQLYEAIARTPSRNILVQ